jgi:uncharacterized protein (TIGR00661 family)
MNILFGVQATGNGHISRSREIIRCLKEKRHTVSVILSGRDPALLWDMDEFMPYTTFKGLTFSTYRGKIRYLDTLKNLDLKGFFSDVNSFDVSGFDIVITDFEPVSSRIAKRHHIPSIGIGHQYAFYYDIPTAGKTPVSNYIIRNFAPLDYPVGLHWHHFGQPILPPVVPRLNENVSSIENKILVYLPFEEQEDILTLITPFKNYDFFVYHKFETPSINKNIHLCPFSRNGFLNDLIECSGVITNAGFELVSEALATGKKILLKPLAGQMEQLSNAKAITMLSLGQAMKSLDSREVETFLNLPQASPINYPYTAEIIADIIDSGAWADMNRFVKEAWANVNIASYAAAS